ncbi:MAG: foldase protein PrsA [Clostridiales bacterium]|jgi:foldase protein PrsA|nr:foldase protein PrsA [Clostridiales bacterium]
MFKKPFDKSIKEELFYLKIKALSIAISISLMLILMFSGCSGTNGEIAKNKEVATVNGEKVTVEEYDFFLQTVKQQMEEEARQQNVENVWEQEIEGKKAVDVAKEKALEAVVKNEVQLLKAKELGLRLTEEDKKEITRQKKAYMESLGGRENYQKVLKNMGLTDKSLNMILENNKVLEKLYMKTTSENAEYNISEQEIKDYYEKNKEDFKNPTVKAKHILFKTVDDQQPPQPLPQEKQDEAKRKAEEIYARIKAGEDFDKLMNEYSEDDGLKTYPDGYTFGRGEMVPEFEEAAFSLSVGEVSDIVKTDYGYHIIKVEDKYEYLPIDQVKEGIKQVLIYEKYNETVEKWKKEANIKPNEEVLKQIKVKTKTE